MGSLLVQPPKISAKFPYIKLLLDSFEEANKRVQVLCLQETWIENSDLIDMAQIYIDNYHLVTKNRYASAHGGLAFYIYKNWNFITRTHTIESLNWEEMIVELTNPANPSKIKLTVGHIYRPPHATVAQLKLFINCFTQRLTMLNSCETIFVCGDYNINLLSRNTDENTVCYNDGILSSGFLPTITLPTRTSDRSTLIDNIFTNKQEQINFADILINEISDHQAMIHKFFIGTYQKAPIVQHYTYNTIIASNYIHISCTHIDKGERYITSTPIVDIINSIHTYIVD